MAIVRVALFSNPYQRYDEFTHENAESSVLYMGQPIRSTFDNYFNRPNTVFYVFRKHRLGWGFEGKACVSQMVRERSRGTPPVWKLELWTHDDECNEISEAIRSFHQSHPMTYLRKDTLLDVIRIQPKINTTAWGIVPLK